jgi:hypothetical protein
MAIQDLQSQLLALSADEKVSLIQFLSVVNL